MEQHQVTANGLEFSTFDEGPGDGTLALCLHGFPDSAHTWRFLLPRLGAAGFHAVAPFLRGYAPTEIPGDGRYQIGALIRDANALHDALGGAHRLRSRGPSAGSVASSSHHGSPAPRVHRDVPVHLRAAPAQLVHLLLSLAAGRHGATAGRLRLHRRALARLVAGL